MATTKKTTNGKTTSKKTTTAAKPAATVAKSAASSAQATRSISTSSPAAKTISQAERQRLIEQAAYFRAEKQGFSGNPQDHWASALAEVTADLTRKKIRVV